MPVKPALKLMHAEGLAVVTLVATDVNFAGGCAYVPTPSHKDL